MAKKIGQGTFPEVPGYRPRPQARPAVTPPQPPVPRPKAPATTPEAPKKA